ncbi:MAG: hypothetical protein ABL985_10885 [Casimicrobium sp.]
MNSPIIRRRIALICLAATVSFTPPVFAHDRFGPSGGSLLLSALPVVSVAYAGAAAGAASAATVALPVALSVTGSVLVVKTIESTARGTICVLERASDGARVSVEVAARGTERAFMSVGQSVEVSVVGAGAVLSVAGEAIAFVPNALGRALLHNERLTW